MNFVETGKPGMFLEPTPDTAVMTSEPTAAKKSSNTKTFFASMAVALIFFPFTLSGMMSATNWTIDQFVIPRMTAQSKQWNTALPGAPVTADDSSTANAADTAR